MSILTPSRPGVRVVEGDLDHGAQAAASLFDGVGGESSLDELVSGTWEGLAAHRSVACPLCGGEMKPEYGAHALPVGGRCRTCDTTLS